LKGHFHERAPSKIFKRAVRGMLPYKTPRGAAAFDSLEVYEGVPEKYETKKKMVAHSALKVLRLKPHRKFCVLGQLSTVVGWKYAPVVEKLETARKAKALTWYKQKVISNKLLKKAQEKVSQTSEVKKIDAQLKQLGY
jgi:large subunit ribosomal protein L13Ae